MVQSIAGWLKKLVMQILPGPGMNPFSCRPNNKEDKVMEDQKPSVFRMYNAGPFSWVRPNMEYIFVMIESTGRQLFPRMNWKGSSGLTRANVPQLSLTLDSGATIHFFIDQELLNQSRRATER